MPRAPKGQVRRRALRHLARRAIHLSLTTLASEQASDEPTRAVRYVEPCVVGGEFGPYGIMDTPQNMGTRENVMGYRSLIDLLHVYTC